MPQNSLSGSDSRVFAYWEHTPHRWREIFARWRSVGVQIVQLPIYWGVHETLRGNPDFLAPRLKIERIFDVAREEGMTLHLTLGCSHFESFPGEAQFPVWVWEDVRRSVVPLSLWRGRDFGLFVTDAPYLWSDAVITGFSEFLRAAVDLISPHIADSGAIGEVQLSLLPWERDLAFHHSERFQAGWGHRFPTVGVVNQLFGTGFGVGTALHAPNVLKTLSERRAWVTSCHYQLVREATLQPLRDIFQRCLVGGQPTTQAVLWDGSLAFFDSVDAGASVFPFHPAALLSPAATESQALVQKAVAAARAAGVPLLSTLSPVFRNESEQLTEVTVVCGKYLDRTSANRLKAIQSRGGKVAFLHETPVYDEWLEPLALRSLVPRVSGASGEVSL